MTSINIGTKQSSLLKCNLCLRQVDFNSRNVHTIRSTFTNTMKREVSFGLCLQDDCSQTVQARVEQERNQLFIKEMLANRPKLQNSYVRPIIQLKDNDRVSDIEIN